MSPRRSPSFREALVSPWQHQPFTRRAPLAVLAAIACLAALLGAASAGASRVGGPPHWPPLGPAVKKGKEAVVLGVGGRPRLELVAYDSVQGPCVYADEIQTANFFGTECNAGFAAPREGPIFIASVGSGGIGRSRHRDSSITGFLSPRVASVRVHYRLAGEERSGTAVVGQIKGSLVRRTGMPGPFGLFAFAVNHCVTSDLTVVAFDREGGELGSLSTSGGPLPIGPPCVPRERSPR
jgi:hypothetical protein